MIVKQVDPVEGESKVPALPIHFSGEIFEVRSLAKPRGADQAEVLARLGLAPPKA
jgi:hypothetical protein